MSRTVMVAKEECTSCNLCVEMLPEVFKLDENQLSEVISSSAATQDKIQEVIDSCPAQCIKWE